MKKRFFFLPLLALFLFACKNPADPSNNPPPAPSGGAIKAKVQFDPNTITCQRNDIELAPGDEVKENDMLYFYAKLTGDTVVKTWYRNEIDTNRDGNYYYCTVKDYSVMEEGGQKVIKVRYTTKTALKAKVQFDPNTITCKRNNIELAPGDEVKENDGLYFYAKLTGDNVVKTWYRNETDTNANGNYYYCTVKDYSVMEEGGQNVIKVRYTIK